MYKKKIIIKASKVNKKQATKSENQQNQGGIFLLQNVTSQEYTHTNI